MDNYYEIKRCSNSELTAMWRELNGFPPLDKNNPNLHFGKFYHTELFEPHKSVLQHHFVEKDKNMIRVMVDESLKNANLKMFATHRDAQKEEEHFFEFEGVPFKAKIDSRIHTWGCDAKTTSTTSLGAFIDTFHGYGYWRQAAIYMYAAKLTKFTFHGIQKKMDKPKIFMVNAHDYPNELKTAMIEAKTLVLHYAKKNNIIV